MDRIESGRDGVLVYRHVPIVDTTEHRAYAYLNVIGLPRDLPSTVVRVFVDGPDVTATSGTDAADLLGEATTYNSPPVPGPARPARTGEPLPDDHGSYDLLVDVSDGIRRLGPADQVDLALVLTDPGGRPRDVTGLALSDLKVTRHR